MPYTFRMKSIADALRAESIAADARRTFGERLRLALANGRRDVRVLAAARGVSETEARRLIGMQRQRGRRRSACHESLFE